MYKTLWNNPDIRFYMTAGAVSKLGDSLSAMAFLFLAYDLTGSALHTTGIALAETIPYLLFGLIGGGVADALPKKRLLVTLDLLRVPLMLTVVALEMMNMLSFSVLFASSFLIQSAGCFFNPAHRSVLPMVTTEAERSAANSLYDTLTRGITIATPVAAAALIQTAGVIHFFTLDACTYLLSAFVLSKLHLKESNKRLPSPKFIFSSIYEFLTWMVGKVRVRHLFVLTFYTVFLNTWVWEVGILLALEELTSESEKLYSMIKGVFGAVVIITNLCIPFFIRSFSLKHYITGACLWGLGLFYLGVFYSPGHFFIGTILIGIGLPTASLARVYLIQKLVPEEKMGRAFSTNAVLLYGSNTLSLLLYGLLTSILSTPSLMMVSGALMLIPFFTIVLWMLIGSTKLSRRFPVHFFK
ncbi:MFS transporter [Halobacillus sp. Cin3]|uniref:MFS transporter n=1 Tax=Halobacillus sp. Cin3 TaxID=2928441 RepID=UPI00248D6DCF|nr:MFS transporter [Halobacillus sp. Cin3]